MMFPFLKLIDCIIHPLLSPVLSGFFLLGVFFLSTLVLKTVLKREVTAIESACGYMLLLSLLSISIFLLSATHSVSFVSLRWIGYSFVILGGYSIWFYRDQFSPFITQQIKSWSSSSNWDRLDMVLFGSLLVGYVLAVSGPVSDADSLDYHIGVPLDLLRNGGFVPSMTWFHSRLIGMGEFLNLLGLGMGTDNLGAFVQLSGLAWILIVIHSSAASSERRVLGMKLILSAPLFLFLITNQKPQLIGTAAIISAIALIVQQKRLFSGHVILAMGSLFLALSLKYSFYIFGGMSLLFIGYHSWKNQKLRIFMGVSLLGYLIFIFPLHLFNFIQYGSPVSPLFSGVFQTVDADLMQGFVSRLSNYKEGFGFPLGLFIPSSPGVMSTAIGIGFFAIFFIRKGSSCSKPYLLLVSIGGVLVTVFCQTTSRFYLEVFVLLTLGVVTSSKLSTKIWIFKRMVSMQMAGHLALVLFGVFVLWPGSWSFHHRDAVMSRTAHEYAALSWVDQNLPKEAFIISDFRSSALLPRAFLAMDHLSVFKTHPDLFYKELKKSNGHPIYYLTKGKISPSHPYSPFVKRSVVDGKEFRGGTRNPFNVGTYRLYVYQMTDRFNKKIL